MSTRRAVVIMVVAAVAIAVVVAFALFARSDDAPASGETVVLDSVGAAPADGAVVGNAGDPASSASGASEGATPAPVAGDGDEEDRLPPYSSRSVEVKAPGTDARGAEARSEAVRSLERATDGVHACERAAQAEHDRLKRPGRADPMLCVYDHTAMQKERGSVRMDIVTPNGYSYFVQGDDGTRYRYSEYDGNACRSIDGITGCSAW